MDNLKKENTRKTKVRIALVALFGITLFVCGLPISSAAPDHQGERRHSKKGPEVAKRVRQLQKYNNGVRQALAAFERNEGRNRHAPRIDEAESVTLDSAGGSAALNLVKDTPFQKVGFRPQGTDFSGYGLEIITIPTYTAPGEWQGTIILNKFDPSGGYIGQYVADVVIGPDSTQTFLDVNFEVSFEGDNAYLECGDPNTYGYLGDPGAGGGFLPPPISSLGNAKVFEKASYNPQLNPFRLGQRIGGANPRVRQVVRCTWGTSAVGGLTCGVVSGFFAEIPFIPCLLGAATLASSGCALNAVFRY
jgi:hypothetical protein